MDIHGEIMELLIYGAIYTVIVFVIGFSWGYYIAKNK